MLDLNGFLFVEIDHADYRLEYAIDLGRDDLDAAIAWISVLEAAHGPENIHLRYECVIPPRQP